MVKYALLDSLLLETGFGTIIKHLPILSFKNKGLLLGVVFSSEDDKNKNPIILYTSYGFRPKCYKEQYHSSSKYPAHECGILSQPRVHMFQETEWPKSKMYFFSSEIARMGHVMTIGWITTQKRNASVNHLIRIKKSEVSEKSGDRKTIKMIP